MTKANVKGIEPAQETAVVVRTPEVIAIEIRSIDNQAREFVLRSAVEIGKRLTEAKTLVAHGQWGKWIEENLPYSQSTANNFMRIATEYTPETSPALASLSYTQAVALLGMPAESREAFVQENNVTDMSSRELQAAIKANQVLEKKLKEIEEESKEQAGKYNDWAKKLGAERQQLSEQYETERKLRQEQEEQIQQLQKEIEASQAAGDTKALAKAKADLRRAEKASSDTQKRLSELESGMEEAVKKRTAEIEAQAAETMKKREQELAEELKKRENETAKQLADMEEKLRKNNNTAAIKVKLHFESLLGTFNQLIAAVNELENPEQKKAIQERIGQTCDEMKAKLN